MIIQNFTPNSKEGFERLHSATTTTILSTIKNGTSNSIFKYLNRNSGDSSTVISGVEYGKLKDGQTYTTKDFLNDSLTSIDSKFTNTERSLSTGIIISTGNVKLTEGILETGATSSSIIHDSTLLSNSIAKQRINVEDETKEKLRLKATPRVHKFVIKNETEVLDAYHSHTAELTNDGYQVIHSGKVLEYIRLAVQTNTGASKLDGEDLHKNTKIQGLKYNKVYDFAPASFTAADIVEAKKVKFHNQQINSAYRAGELIVFTADDTKTDKLAVDMLLTLQKTGGGEFKAKVVSKSGVYITLKVVQSVDFTGVNASDLTITDIPEKYISNIALIPSAILIYNPRFRNEIHTQMNDPKYIQVTYKDMVTGMSAPFAKLEEGTSFTDYYGHGIVNIRPLGIEQSSPIFTSTVATELSITSSSALLENIFIVK